DEDDDGGVRVIDRKTRSPEEAEMQPLRATAGKREPRVVPLEGTIVLWGDDARTAEGTLDAVARHAYTQLLTRVASRLAAERSPDADLDRAHLVRGAELGFARGKDLRDDVAMPFGRRGTRTLGEIVTLLGSSTAVVVLGDGEDGDHEALARYAVFVDDGSLAARRLALALGPRAISRSDALALALGLRKADRTISIPPPPPEPKPAAPPKKKAPSKAGGASPTRATRVSSGPVEPLAARTSAKLRELGHGADVSVRASRSEPLAESTPDGISLAGASELLALAAGTPVHRERAALLLAAHALTIRIEGRGARLAALARLLG
ncbi:MAG TPA: hypothetical protein VL400_04980, partial [Polyangiaceae bacterium]|nr:hypothetical protein [Polyangiaceae bacterium]